MNTNCQLILHQIQTTPQSLIKSAPDTTLPEMNNQQHQKKLAQSTNILAASQTFINLISSPKNTIREKTGFLHLCDNYWALSLIDNESFNIINEKYGVSKVPNKLNQISIVVKYCCDNNATKLKGFECNDLIDDTHVDINNDCQHDVFGLLINVLSSKIQNIRKIYFKID